MYKDDFWAVIYNNNKIIGYTPTFKEADDICKKNNTYSWDYARRVFKNKQKRIDMFKILEQITI